MALKIHKIMRIFTLTAFSLSVLISNGCKFSNNVAGKKTNVTSENHAKNVILFIGDGMGVSTVTAGRIFVGQEMGLSGEEHVLSFETFENVALIKTYNTNAQVPDSAGTATSIMSGYKTNIGTINVRPTEKFSGCGDIAADPTLAYRANAAGKSVGIISTARITHATPAAMYGYADSRGWEADKDLPEEAQSFGCQSLAAQLTAQNTPVNLALGGGSKEFSPQQLDSWASRDDSHLYIETVSDFEALDPQEGHDVLGLFTDSHMSFEADRDPNAEPSLADMTAYAIDNLSSRNDKGYILMIEAGRIDHAHHGGNAYRALKDFQAMDAAVKMALEKTGDDTLILVTADHSHVFTIGGYPVRGNPILGLVRSFDEETGKISKEYATALDDKPYTTLGYHNGPGDLRRAEDPALTDNLVQSKNYRQQIAIPRSSETHAGEDVPLYANGPGADEVKGVMEQNEIFNVMINAMGVE